MTDGATLFDPVLPDPPTPPVVRVRLLVSYDGGAFHGYAEQPGLHTVAGTLSQAIERVLRHRVTLSGAGRTDRGVHAWGQVVTFDARAEGFDPAPLQRSLNKLCGPALAVRQISVEATGFDARFSATARRYRYLVLNREVHDPLRLRTHWHIAAPLDLAAMRLGCDPFIGEHDFSSFCRRPKTVPSDDQPKSLARRVDEAFWCSDGDDVLRFEIEANAFCHQMVRSIVGILIDVGLGKRRPGDLLGVLRARDRSVAGQPAPPHGLMLWSVSYGDIATRFNHPPKS